MSVATKNIVMALHPSTRPPKSLGLRKGAWTAEEDALLTKCMEKYGIVRWHLIPQRAGIIYSQAFLLAWIYIVYASSFLSSEISDNIAYTSLYVEDC